MTPVPTRDELLEKVKAMAARAGVKFCEQCDNTGKLAEDDDGNTSWRLCPCRWDSQ